MQQISPRIRAKPSTLVSDGSSDADDETGEVLGEVVRGSVGRSMPNQSHAQARQPRSAAPLPTDDEISSVSSETTDVLAAKIDSR